MSRCLLLLAVIVIPAMDMAQYDIGLRLGAAEPTPVTSSFRDRVSHRPSPVFGVSIIHGGDGTGNFRLSLDFLQRVFDLRQLNASGDRMELLRMRQSFLFLSTEVRWPLNAGSSVFFDLGPMIGAQISEKANGMDMPTGNYRDTIGPMPVDERTVGPLRIREVRLRLGPSVDIPVDPRLHLTGVVGIAPGWSDAYRGRGRFNVDVQLMASVYWSLRRPKPP